MVVSLDSERSVPSLTELSVSRPNKNNILVQDKNTTINSNCLDGLNCPVKLDNLTLDSTGKPIVAPLTIKPWDARTEEGDIMEITKQKIQVFVRILDQPSFKKQSSVYCHFKNEYDDGKDEKENHHFRLGLGHNDSQIELEMSVNEINNELQRRIENLEL